MLDYFPRIGPHMIARLERMATTKAIDPRLVDEVAAINAAFDSATKALEAGRQAPQHKSGAPIQIAEFPCG
jgi:hypothetical protein